MPPAQGPLHVCPLAVRLLRNKVPHQEIGSEKEPQPLTITGAVLEVQRLRFVEEPWGFTCPPACRGGGRGEWLTHLPAGGGAHTHTCLRGTGVTNAGG